MTEHMHLMYRAVTRPWFGCVAPRRCVEGAHGNIVERQTCRCGAYRDVAINRAYREAGPWIVVEAKSSL